jgi:hypothetical protein
MGLHSDKSQGAQVALEEGLSLIREQGSITVLALWMIQSLRIVIRTTTFKLCQDSRGFRLDSLINQNH